MPMRTRRSKLRPGWWISTVLFLLVLAVAYLAWLLPAQRAHDGLDVRFYDSPKEPEP